MSEPKELKEKIFKLIEKSEKNKRWEYIDIAEARIPWVRAFCTLYDFKVKIPGPNNNLYGAHKIKLKRLDSGVVKIRVVPIGFAPPDNKFEIISKTEKSFYK